MNPLLRPLVISTRSLAHFVDQPQVIRAIDRVMAVQGPAAATALMAGYDITTASPESRAKTAIQDAFILGPTLGATVWGHRIVSERPEALAPVSKAIRDQYPNQPRLQKLFSRLEKPNVRGKYTLPEIKEILSTVYKAGGKQAGSHLERIFPIHVHAHGYAGMLKFFGVGGVIVLAGMAGGLLHSLLFEPEARQKRQNIVQEGIFQFIANIALCAVGATGGMKLANMMGLKGKQLPLPKAMGRLGLILGGLSVGIFGGAALANTLGRHYINPLLNWWEKRQTGLTLADALRQPKERDNRQVESLDYLLHVDDLPMGLAIAGVQFFEPVIPVFFAFSAWRAGKGYRNVHHHSREWPAPALFKANERPVSAFQLCSVLRQPPPPPMFAQAPWPMAPYSRVMPTGAPWPASLP